MLDRCVCINLDRRPERWEAFLGRFPVDWPWTRPERWSAIDGKACDIPQWHLGPAGAWGCLRSHLAVWRWQVANGFESVLVLEDDAVFSRNAVETIRETMSLLPADWDQVYFGGQHLDTLQWGLGFLAEEGPRLVTSSLPSGYRDVFEGSFVAGGHATHFFLPFLQVS